MSVHARRSPFSRVDGGSWHLYGRKSQSEFARTFVKSTNVRTPGSNVRSWGANVRLFARNVRQTNVRTEPGTERSSDERSFPECERSKPTSPVRTHRLDGRRPGRTFGPRDERSFDERSSERTFEPRNERSHRADERSQKSPYTAVWGRKSE